MRLQKACFNALDAGHRVAVLIETWSPESLFEDVNLLVRSDETDGDYLADALLGLVSDEGELKHKIPFSVARPKPVIAKKLTSPEAIPPEALDHLQKAINKRKSGILIFGSDPFEENPGANLVASSLSLTELAGPAARIVPMFRSSPKEDLILPEPIKNLPFLPSIESAYEQGYRRLIINPVYTDRETMFEYAEKAIIIIGAYGGEVDGLFARSLRGYSSQEDEDLLPLLIGVLGIKYIQKKKKLMPINDLYVPKSQVSHDRNGEVLYKFLMKHRVLKWEDQLAEMLNAGLVTSKEVETSLPNNHEVKAFLSSKIKLKKRQ